LRIPNLSIAEGFSSRCSALRGGRSREENLPRTVSDRASYRLWTMVRSQGGLFSLVSIQLANASA